ncbi:hypothetical protein FOZ63_018872 [Perkinsus olseni]|uniref:Pseudouridine synthase RsuA/RluA-like domain-containing protein n=2 Tax=Perkinsus olseni TaxID=32597 RepID=A0A7J6Q7I9_PEROL|nr:hypothetical protein FOZ63_018872 [Perkinsus olseni]
MPITHTPYSPLSLLIPRIGAYSGRGFATMAATTERKEPPKAVIELFDVLREESLNRMKDFEANHLFSLVWAYSTAKRLDKQLYEACLDRVRQLGNKKDEAKGRGVGERPPPVDMDEMDTTVPAVLHETKHLSVIWKPAHWHVSVTSAIAGAAEEEVVDDTTDEETEARDSAVRTVSSANGNASGLQEWIEEAYPGYPIAKDRHHAHGILHRLDVGTSGPLLLAHSYKGFYMGRLVFCSHQIDKEYVALVKGHMGTVGEKVVISDRIKILKSTLDNGQSYSTTCVVAPDGKPSLTEAVPVAHYYDGSGVEYSLVLVKLHTGRTHQIRVHMAHIGHPLVCDPKYGNPTDPEAARAVCATDRLWCPRTFLHSYRLCYNQPIDVVDEKDATVDVYVPLPLDLRLALAKLTPGSDDCTETARWLSGKQGDVEGRSFLSK